MRRRVATQGQSDAQTQRSIRVGTSRNVRVLGWNKHHGLLRQTLRRRGWARCARQANRAGRAARC
ncbi:hypothetical protein FPL06_13460 [Xanthomonas citri pv. glycines]|nr:hypothetical protein BHE84_23860 [Xanthomonas citri pv. glycines str. 8ra]QDR45288.1 hypothetical protein FPK90_11760 [Xanthomonas citri pv. glycines]QDS07412.1 hypothetical protein FPL00_11455 [Xanthomonas citri pv. glycines]QDS11753.1 hypothetical protein FPL03_11725 [Xanthomonas citri pv. glycines]QDS20358.1 hypothetical protein FPL05_11825 [Xanthomonas citri pv. glycines]